MKQNKWPIAIVSLLIIGSCSGYYFLGSYKQLLLQNNQPKSDDFEYLSAQQIRDKRITDIQSKLYADKQNAQLWYTLGNAYMYNGDYDNAQLVYDYSLRLSTTPTADHYASKASALYYSNGQKISPQVQSLLSSALALDENNQTAVMMLASNEFMNVRYQKAIDLWVKLLDSEQAGLDRAKIINSINQAKKFIR